MYIRINVLQKLDHCYTITIFFYCVTRRRRFILKDTGAYGKQSDFGKFSASTVYHFLEGPEFTLPKPANFEGSGTEVPVIVLGNEAYPLRMSLMKPSARKDLSGEERVFNYWLSRQGSALSVPLVV